MKRLILLLMFLLLIPAALAAPPFTQEITGTSGCEIKYPQLTNIKINTLYTLNFHIFNYTDGFTLTDNTTVKCHLHIYNSSGNHIYDEDVTKVDHHYDWQAEIPITNSSQIGWHSYVFQCNYTNGLQKTGCAISDQYEITEQTIIENPLNSIAVIIGMALIVITFITLSFLIKNNYARMFLVSLAALAILAMIGMMIKISSGESVFNLTITLYESFGWIIELLIYGLLVFIIVKALFGLINYDKEKIVREEEDEDE